MKVVACLAATVLVGMTLGGCYSSTSLHSILHNLSPELSGTAEREVDIQRNYAVMADANCRMFRDDWGRVWYTDHPSRLSPMPITYTSGMPR
jgi:hypothetical protein